MFFTH